MSKVNISKGQRFNKLVVIKEVDRFIQPSGQTQRGFLCICDCGKEKKVRLSHLTSGRVKSCNCDAHGKAGSKLHTTWRAMKNRCLPTYNESHLYYDKGVRLCDEWQKFNSFSDWAYKNGYNEALQIDRIDSNKGYYPNNCRFVTPKENSNNRYNTIMVEYKGKTQSIRMLLFDLGITESKKVNMILARLKRGWNVEEAIETPKKE